MAEAVHLVAGPVPKLRGELAASAPGTPNTEEGEDEDDEQEEELLVLLLAFFFST